MPSDTGTDSRDIPHTLPSPIFYERPPVVKVLSIFYDPTTCYAEQLIVIDEEI
jgi:hypothetical protein